MYYSLKGLAYDLSQNYFNGGEPYHYSVLVNTVIKTIQEEYGWPEDVANTISKYMWFSGINSLDYVYKVMDFCNLHNLLNNLTQEE